MHEQPHVAPLLTAREAATLLGVSLRMLRYFRDAKALPSLTRNSRVTLYEAAPVVELARHLRAAERDAARRRTEQAAKPRRGGAA